MPKALCLLGMMVAILIAILFIADLAAGVPFQKASILMDIALIVCALMLGAISWFTFKEQA
ncbi:hypothetical protein Psta_3766 [Pirellula staleyi DSM 6068]|uniref:Uncharacterized protein n=1 Tax=Pirellula staleyi (strain ATCC 27377 / DSM 6068 / ICPB 4128) TaxID=530564 RepID=D2R056_PIRSD|nr:hypothetical protein [Pirellula staleyi]ADB18421.1 hypothetical protein Psta_3766 [Pirellula staleyi DSM 6068]